MIDQAHYENFPVASWVLPAKLRVAVRDIYRFARYADDIADEGNMPDTERRKHLEQLQSELQIMQTHTEQFPEALKDSAHAFFLLPLWTTMQKHALSYTHLQNLLLAFIQDTYPVYYQTYPEVLGYCQHSANPVGRLMLELSKVTDEGGGAYQQSDAICTALQLLNFLQDILIDWHKQRLYIPISEWHAHHLDPSMIPQLLQTSHAHIAQHTDWQRFMAAQTARALQLLQDGAPVVQHISGRMHWELKAIILGGFRIAKKLQSRQYDIFFHRPTLESSDYVRIAWQSMRFSATLKNTSHDRPLV